MYFCVRIIILLIFFTNYNKALKGDKKLNNTETTAKKYEESQLRRSELNQFSVNRRKTSKRQQSRKMLYIIMSLKNSLEFEELRYNISGFSDAAPPEITGIVMAGLDAGINMLQTVVDYFNLKESGGIYAGPNINDTNHNRTAMDDLSHKELHETNLKEKIEKGNWIVDGKINWYPLKRLLKRLSHICNDLRKLIKIFEQAHNLPSGLLVIEKIKNKRRVIIERRKFTLYIQRVVHNIIWLLETLLLLLGYDKTNFKWKNGVGPALNAYSNNTGMEVIIEIEDAWIEYINNEDYPTDDGDNFTTPNIYLGSTSPLALNRTIQSALSRTLSFHTSAPVSNETKSDSSDSTELDTSFLKFFASDNYTQDISLETFKANSDVIFYVYNNYDYEMNNNNSDEQY